MFGVNKSCFLQISYLCRDTRLLFETSRSSTPEDRTYPQGRNRNEAIFHRQSHPPLNSIELRDTSCCSICLTCRATRYTPSYTLDEEAEAAAAEVARIAEESEPAPETIPKPLDDVVNPTLEIPEPSPESIEFWGGGLPPEMYPALDARYAKWTNDFSGGLDSASEARYKQICILEETINRSVTQAGKSDAATVNALNNLIKDAQKGDGTEADGEFDALPFGVGIRMFENARPVPKPIPELQDVDGIVKYISVWFLGHLCKMLGIKNAYCKLYEEEMARRRVERPDLEEEDDEGAFSDIFANAGDDE